MSPVTLNEFYMSMGFSNASIERQPVACAYDMLMDEITMPIISQNIIMTYVCNFCKGGQGRGLWWECTHCAREYEGFTRPIYSSSPCALVGSQWLQNHFRSKAISALLGRKALSPTRDQVLAHRHFQRDAFAQAYHFGLVNTTLSLSFFFEVRWFQSVKFAANERSICPSHSLVIVVPNG